MSRTETTTSSTRPLPEDAGTPSALPVLDARAPLDSALSTFALADDAAAHAPSVPSSTTDQRDPRDAAVSLASRLNWLRAGVLGANDGIVSVAGLVIGVAAATPENTSAILTAGVAGVLAGAVSMAAGEYVSVSTQSDTERALVVRQREELAQDPEAGIDELASHYRAKGLSPATAMTVARELTAHDAVGAHLEAELGLREDEYTNPWHAAFSSAVAFILGSLLPMLAIVLLPTAVKIPLTFAAVLVGLALTGGVSARLGEAPVRPAVIRNMAGGALAMAVTWGIGHLIGVSV
ncbi:VIT1/CCC1 transporter family protein [Actinomyces faecalis]|uniref:VIT1/CCC1 transporter family protein n=1 Tax=Actinomyces faecalis TaxID=2722820 RepID=UPI001C55282D|nr:VIT family protein [Actinomyces faecalis]